MKNDNTKPVNDANGNPIVYNDLEMMKVGGNNNLIIWKDCSSNRTFMEVIINPANAHISPVTKNKTTGRESGGNIVYSSTGMQGIAIARTKFNDTIRGIVTILAKPTDESKSKYELQEQEAKHPKSSDNSSLAQF